jgi:hypothetical protein
VHQQQQLAWVEQEPLYQIYLDLSKAYDSLDWTQCLEILAGYTICTYLLDHAITLLLMHRIASYGITTRDAIAGVDQQHHLAWVEQEPLYQIYLDLRKAYDSLDWTWYLEILAGYGVGPNL